MVCFECEAKANHAHHVVPKVLGGTKTVSLCAICHAKIHGDHLLKTSELTKAGMKKAKDAGFHVCGRAPFGYEIVSGKLQKSEHQQKIVKEMVQMKSAGISLSVISDVLKIKYKINLARSSIRRTIIRARNEIITE